MNIAGKLKETLDSWRRLIMLARKPDKEEFMLSLKISLLGFTIVGALAFVIHLVAYMLLH